MKKKLLIKSLCFLVFYVSLFASNAVAQDAFMGYNYVTTTVPLAWSTSPTTFNASTAKEIIFSNSGGSVKSATICATTNISHYELGGTAHLVEVNLTTNSTASTFTIELTGSSNSTTVDACAAGVVFSDQIPFSETSCIGAVTSDFFPISSGAWKKITITPPAGTKSLRVYRRVYYGAGSMSTSSGSGRVQYGLGQTIRLASIAATVTSATTPALTAPASLTSFGSIATGTNSTSQNFNLTGSLLTGAPGTLTVTAPNTDFQVSSNNTAWGTTATIPYTSATLAATPVYVRFTPQTLGAKSGNITIAGGGATTINVAVSGTGTGPIYNYRSKQSGNWSDATTWEYDNGGWINAVVAPTDADGTITIQNTHVVTVNAAASVDELTVATGGELAIATATTLTIANGTGTDFTVNGKLKNSGVLTTTGSTLAMGAAGTYQHDATTAIPTITWTAGSTCLITGGTGVPSGGFGQAFANLVWNCAAQTTQVVIAVTGFTVTENFNVVSTGTGGIQMISSGGVTNAVVGSYTQSGGWVYVYPNTAGRSLTSNGNFTLNGGMFSMSGQGGTGYGTLYVKGNVALNAGSITRFAGTKAYMVLNGTTPQNISAAITAVDTFSATINNPAGVTLLSPILLNDTVRFTTGIVNTTASNYLILGSSATVTGASATSFVNGPVIRYAAGITSTDLVYPIGKGTAYAPVTLTVTQAASTPTTYTAEVFNTAPTTRTLPGTLQRVSNTRYYNISKGAGASITAGQVKLIYDANDASTTGVDVSDKNNLRIVKDDGGTNWLDLGPVTGGSANNTGDITSTIPFTSFSDFAIANVTAIVPVKFVAINAKTVADKININWEVATEINANYYEVQRSSSNNDFITIAKVSATNAIRYSANDLSPLQGVNIYRIKAVDKDGSITYSSVVRVKKGKANMEELTVMPNPITGKKLTMQLAGYSKGYYTLNVYNSIGILVYVKQIALSEGNTTVNVQLPTTLAKGVYQIAFVSKDIKTTKTISIQ